MASLRHLCCFMCIILLDDAHGQCTNWNCNDDSASRPEANILKSGDIEELVRDLKVMYQTLYSKIDTIENSLREANEGLAKSVDHKLQSLYENVSLGFAKIDEEFVKLNNKSLDKAFGQNLLTKCQKNADTLESVLKQTKENNLLAISKGQCETDSDVCDCSRIKSMGFNASGVYRLYVVRDRSRFYKEAYCDLSSGAWTVFQRRKDGSENFYRGWNDYANGFGNPNGEFWLGNEFLHLLTSKKHYRLGINFEDFEGGKRYAVYTRFGIGSSTDKYKLTVSDYSGNSGDSLNEWHSGRNFTTKDSDNDERSAGNCALERRGGWWYQDCTDSNLNGIYYRGTYSSCSGCNLEGITWYGWRGSKYSLKMTEMRIQ